MPEPMTREQIYEEFRAGNTDESNFGAVLVDEMADEILRLRATLAQRREATIAEAFVASRPDADAIIDSVMTGKWSTPERELVASCLRLEGLPPHQVSACADAVMKTLKDHRYAVCQVPT